jgi:hypothetical protein
MPPGAFVVGQAYRGAGIPDCARGRRGRARSLTRRRLSSTYGDGEDSWSSGVDHVFATVETISYSQPRSRAVDGVCR